MPFQPSFAPRTDPAPSVRAQHETADDRHRGRSCCVLSEVKPAEAGLKESTPSCCHLYGRRARVGGRHLVSPG